MLIAQYGNTYTGTLADDLDLFKDPDVVPWTINIGRYTKSELFFLNIQPEDQFL